MPQTLESDLRLAQFIPLKRVRTLAKAISIYEVVGLTGEVRPVGEALYYTYYEPQEGHEYGSGMGRVAVADSEGPMTTVRGTEVLQDIGPPSSLTADDEHVYVTVEGLGLLIYPAE